jgi:TetR/AcrR family transcriptional regulator, transcriptional repressor for nem operon
MQIVTIQADTRTRILDVAQDLVQRRGVNAMSFQDLADAVGIRKASVHHHFPDKAAMVVALLERYQENFAAQVQIILVADCLGSEQIERYMQLFVDTLAETPHNRVCLCGMLATEVATLDPEGVKRVRVFFADNIQWITQMLQRGRADGSLVFRGDVSDTASLVFSTLEGCLIVARCDGGPRQMQAMLRPLLGLLGKA